MSVSSHLFDLSDYFKLCCGVEVHAFLAQQQAQVAGDVPAGYIYTHDAVWHGKALVHWYCMGHPITCIKHYTCCPPCCISTGIYNSK